MLKFFRRIRRKLLDEGNLKRYLIYAVGEILLVVIGILIAVQLNNLNKNNSNRKELQNSYQNLYLDLKADIIVFNERDTALTEIVKSIESIKHLFLRENNISDILDLRKIPGLWNPQLSFNDGTYQTLIGTGLLYNSGNDEFILQINEYYKQVKNTNGMMKSMGVGNKFVRDQEILIPFRYMLNADDSFFLPDANSLLWMNDPRNYTYQAVHNYLGFSLRQAKAKQRELNKSISMNESLQRVVLLLLSNK